MKDRHECIHILLYYKRCGWGDTKKYISQTNHPESNSELEKRRLCTNTKPTHQTGCIPKKDTEKDIGTNYIKGYVENEEMYSYYKDICLSKYVGLQQLQWTRHLIRNFGQYVDPLSLQKYSNFIARKRFAQKKNIFSWKVCRRYE